VRGDIDGADEVVRFGWKYVNIFSGDGFSGSNGIAYNADFTKHPHGWANKNPRYIVDINGDGCCDLVGQGNYGISIAYSKGFIPQNNVRVLNDQFENVGRIINDFGIEMGNWDKTEQCPVMFGDIDGDGRMDVIGVDNIGDYNN
jgi:hypothetical protein